MSTFCGGFRVSLTTWKGKKCAKRERGAIPTKPSPAASSSTGLIVELFSIFHQVYLMHDCYRAAMKMANIDSLLDFMFTDPKDNAGVCKLLSTHILW